MAVAQKGFWELEVGRPAIVVGWQAAVTGRVLVICDCDLNFVINFKREASIDSCAERIVGWVGRLMLVLLGGIATVQFSQQCDFDFFGSIFAFFLQDWQESAILAVVWC